MVLNDFLPQNCSHARIYYNSHAQNGVSIVWASFGGRVTRSARANLLGHIAERCFMLVQEAFMV